MKDAERRRIFHLQPAICRPAILGRVMETPLRRVHLVFKTHLDLGFTDLAARVVDRYVEDFIPRALALSRELREGGGPDGFVWTTGSWIVHEYLERSGPAERRAMEAAIEAGDMTWHALPFTLHSELLDASLFEFGLGLSARLDQRFGRRTIAAKMTDVPGHTRAIVPLLAEAGVRLLHVGVNAASSVPDVPPAFRWQVDGREVVVVYQAKSYGGLAVLPGAPAALYVAHTGDNQGPQTIGQVEDAHRQLRQRFPEAVVEASTLDAFAAEALPDADLPVVTEEIGDTWIHGAGSDPTKVSRFRELCRLRRQWLGDGRSVSDAFSMSLLAVAEHTWGMDEKTRLGDDERYDAAGLAEMRGEERTRIFESSWAEQRAYLDRALAALDGREAAEAETRLSALRATPPDLAGYRAVLPEEPVRTSHFELGVDRRGALTTLIDRATGRSWASPGQPLCLFRYQLFSADDYDRFWDQYVVAGPRDRWWAVRDFTKPGIEHAGIPGGTWDPELIELALRETADEVRLLSQLRLGAGRDVAPGAPGRLVMELVVPRDEPALHVVLHWFDKPACRLPEALWLSFQPPAPDPDGWRLEKLGSRISPRQVVSRGGRTLHAVERRVTYRDDRGGMTLETLDAPLVAPGRMSLLDFHDRLPEPEEGVHVNLFNNVWGTNFPMWCEEDGRFRFSLSFGAPREGSAPPHSR
jgi:Domain of unknown function (DUF5054)